MLIKFSNNVLELPFTYSLRFNNREDFENEINKISNHVREVWGLYSDDDYGYSFVCKSILESDNLVFINNSIKDYLNRRYNSILVIESILLALMKRKGLITLEGDIILKLYFILIDIYHDNVEAYELRYLKNNEIKLLIESIFLKLFLVVRFDYYLSIDELSSLYSNLFFPYFYDFYYLKNSNKEVINREFLSKKISELKKAGLLNDNNLIEWRIHGVLAHYINGTSLGILENNSRKLKQIMTNTRGYFEIRANYFNEAINFMNIIDDDYANFLELSSEDLKNEWNQLLHNFFNEKMDLINRISLINAIVEDILSYAQITIKFKDYEEKFWERYGYSYAYCNREETKELYYLIMSFILLYGHRIKLGKFDYRFFKYLCNTYPEYKLTMEKVRQIFEGTKGSTIFSKVFIKFIYKIVFVNIENELTSKESWMKISSFIDTYYSKTSRGDVIQANIKYTDRKISQFIKLTHDTFDNIVNTTNEMITQLNKRHIEVVSSISEPVRDGEVDPENIRVISRFEKDNGKKELGIIENGKYEKIDIDDLFSLKLSPELKHLLTNSFSGIFYRFTVINHSKQIGSGLIYFYDLDEMSGRYKTLDNINENNKDKIDKEDRYGRFTVNLADSSLYLTGNGAESFLGKYRIKLFKLHFNWEEKKITSEAYHMLKGKIIFQFEAVD